MASGSACYDTCGQYPNEAAALEQMTNPQALRARFVLPGFAPYSSYCKGYRGRMGAADEGPSPVSSNISSSSLTSRDSRSRASDMLCPAYVGQDNPLAGEYYSKDYDWHEHAQQTAGLLEKQWAAAPVAVQRAAKLDASGLPLSALSQFLLELQEGVENSSSSSSRTINGSSPSASATIQPRNSIQPDGAVLQPYSMVEGIQSHQTSSGSSSIHQDLQQQQAASTGPLQQAATQPASENEWEVFYRAHPSARFYKERRYLLLEFPCLAPPSNLQHIVEIGAGCGSSILPVLRAQPHARATVCDISSTCLQQLQDAMRLLRLSPERCTSFVADGTDPALAQQLSCCAADVALIMFTLSAVPPDGMLRMMQNARASLRPGGVLCIRDHALYDMVQLRIPPEQCIGRHLYRRGDDTLAYFYTTEELSGLATAAGLEVVECDYVCVFNRNRKTGQELRRAFVHGVFRRPL